MANEIQYRHTATSATLYATIRNAAGNYWNGSAFVTPSTASWATFSITMTETHYRYMGTFPAGITTAGLYQLEVFSQVGGSPAITDTLLARQTILWDGSAKIDDYACDIDSTGTPVSLPKAVEVILGFAAGICSYNAGTGVWTIKGRDGSTTVATVTITGGGTRTGSTFP